MTTTARIDILVFTVFAAAVLVIAVRICIRFYFREKRYHLVAMIERNMPEPEEEPEPEIEREK
jgi:hypothetical protein